MSKTEGLVEGAKVNTTVAELLVVLYNETVFLRGDSSDQSWSTGDAYRIMAHVIRHGVDKGWKYMHANYGERWLEVAEMLDERGANVTNSVVEEFDAVASGYAFDADRMAQNAVRVSGVMERYVAMEYWDRAQDDLRLMKPEMIKCVWSALVKINRSFFFNRSKVLRFAEKDLRHAFEFLGEPRHGGDLGDGTDPDRNPWSGND